MCSTLSKFHLVCVLSHVQVFATLWTTAHQAPLSMGFSRQQYWSGLHVLLQGIFPTQGSNPHLLCLLHWWEDSQHHLGIPILKWFINKYSALLISLTIFAEICRRKYTDVWIPRCYSGKELTCQCKRGKRHGFDPWVKKILWRRKWHPTPVFLPGKFLGQRRLVSYSP